MRPEHIAAAHAETPTCNAASMAPFTCHSLKCRTKAWALRLVKPSFTRRPRLTVLRGGKAVR